MDKFNFSAKHVAINKANAQIVAVVGLASFISIFCLVAAKAVYSQYQYQSRVIKAASSANTQLKSNISAYKDLVYSYGQFDSASPNILGGAVTGSTNDNAHVILDSLPGQYDFPGLISTIEGILDSTGMQVTAVSGTDEAGTLPGTSATPQPVAMPFSFNISNASYSSTQQLIQTLQQSIRPIPVDSMTVSATAGTLTLSVSAHSYYQPSKVLSISTETVK
jgi:hypothetical protein